MKAFYQHVILAKTKIQVLKCSFPIKQERSLEYRKLGRTGLEVSAVGLGGAQYMEILPQKLVVSIVQEALDNGINIIIPNMIFSNI